MALIDDILALPGGYADAGAVAAQLSLGRTKTVSRYIGVGTVQDTLGPTTGSALLVRLRAIGATTPAVNDAMGLLDQHVLDVGLASVRGQIDALVAQGVMTADQATALKNLAVVPDPVSVYDVLHALEGH